ncbi:helix-turn-helix domain-containing protein [Myxococcaceae bacterium JPH2]|nr:helix-turn-helix domain-containing protein [Myxococcaceae bacterium JPH2]
MLEPKPVSEYQIGRHMMSLWVPQAVHAAAELGLADALAQGPATPAQLAQRLGLHADATHRLLNALVVLDLVSVSDGTFGLTEQGAFLCSDSPKSRRAWARLMGGDSVWRAWGKLTDCVRTGAPAYAAGERRTSETETFDALAEDPVAAEVFHRAMADGTRGVAPDIIAALDFKGVRNIVDVGGGHGELLCAALEAHPQVRGEVFDLAHAKPGATALLARRGLSTRASFRAGDLFRERPPTADLLLMKSVIHDWDDARSLTILQRCREALSDDGTLVVIEPTAQPAGASVPPAFAWIVAFSDLNMLVNTGGRERTAAEFTALLERAELRVEQVRPTANGFYSNFVCRRAR